MKPIIRPADAGDLRRINEIYNEYIVDRKTSFDTEPWTRAERIKWFEKFDTVAGPYRVQVLELSGRVVGFASSGPFRDKAAYASSVETTVVLGGEAVGHGWGASLLGSLLELLQQALVHRAYATVALPNQPSIALHKRFGYRPVGTLDEVGYKLGEFHSVLIMERCFK